MKEVDLRSVFAAVAKEVASVLEDVALVLIYGLFIVLERRFFPIKVQALFPDPERRKNAIRDHGRIDRDVPFLPRSEDSGQFHKRTVSLHFDADCQLELSGEVVGTSHLHLAFHTDHWRHRGNPSTDDACSSRLDSLGQFLLVGIGITAIAQLIGDVVEPNVMGESLNLSPLTVIIALIIWGSLWGIVGAFLCVPLTVILVVSYRISIQRVGSRSCYRRRVRSDPRSNRLLAEKICSLCPGRRLQIDSRVSLPTRFDHCVAHVSDWERSNNFYRDVIGVELVPKNGRWRYRFGNALLTGSMTRGFGGTLGEDSGSTGRK